MVARLLKVAGHNLGIGLIKLATVGFNGNGGRMGHHRASRPLIGCYRLFHALTRFLLLLRVPSLLVKGASLIVLLYLRIYYGVNKT